MDLNGKAILVTGGTGSFGKRFVGRIFKEHPEVRKVVVFSRDELKQFDMAQQFSVEEYPAIRYFLGDVRDRNRLYRAFKDIDIVIHAAALKQVPAAEYNPMEFVNTNIIGAENIINAALDNNVEKVVALSTDKAAAPINLYGATKLCSDKLFIAANNIRGKRNIKFSVVRYGNVMGSRGSVVPFFLKKRETGILPITHPEMTRFNITLDEGVDMVLNAIETAMGGEVFVPKLPSFKIMDLAEAMGKEIKIENVGIRPGEKLHEEMITSSDSYMTVDIGKYYAILPQFDPNVKEKYLNGMNAKMVPDGFSYNSADNDQWLSVEEIKALIKQQIDPKFN